MCESTALQCQQCDKHKTSCRGQVGTFDPEQCPDIPCAKCAACEQGCKQSHFRPEECKKEDGCYCNGGYMMGVDLATGPDCTTKGRYLEDGTLKIESVVPEREAFDELREMIDKGKITFPGPNPALLDELRSMKPFGITLSTRKEVFALYCYMECRDVVACEADECPFFENGACNEGWKEEIEKIKARCLEFLGK